MADLTIDQVPVSGALSLTDKVLVAQGNAILVRTTLGAIATLIGAGGVADGDITNTKLANMPANSVKVRAAATNGVPSDVALAASQLLGRGATGDVAAIAVGNGLSITANTIGILDGGVTFVRLATAALATAAQFRSNTADLLLVTDRVWASASEVALTDAATIAVDMSLGFRFGVTIAGNRTLGNPTNPKVGQTGSIRVTQDGTGGRTLAFGSNWKFTNGTAATIDTVANRDNLISYEVVSSTFIAVYGVLQGVR